MELLESLNAILKSENVTKIYYIDDAHNAEPDYQSATTSALLQLGEGEQLSALVDEYNVLEFGHGDPEIVKSKIDAEWHNWPKEQQFYYFALFCKAADRKGDLEKASLMNFLQVGPFHELITFLSPQQWFDKRDQIIGHATADNRIMILMDQELNLQAGTKGINLLKEIESTEFVYLTLFTYSITQLNEEVTRRNELIDEHGLPSKSFFVLTKDRAMDHSLFIDGIKKVLLNYYFDQMKDHAGSIVEHALERTKQEVSNMDTHDFDLMILKSSLKEGLWEPETLFRIMKMIFDKSIREEMVSQGLPPVINPLIRNARRVSESFRLRGASAEYSKNYALRHREIYDETEIVNGLKMPIDNGDIFEISVGTKKQLWVLVGQECDLMIRSDGESATDYAALYKIDVADIPGLTEKIAQSKFDKIKTNYMEKRFVLYYFEKGHKTLGVVQLSREVVVDRRVLDLVSLNNDGTAKINLVHVYEDDHHLSPSMIHRVGIIQETIRKQIAPQLSPGVTETQTFKLDFCFIPRVKMKNEFQIVSNEIDFGVRRLLRIRKPYSVKLLSKLMQMKARTADDHDFAEIVS